MNVILLERVNNLGDLGDQVAVKAGFARNYLIPQGIAVQANESNLAVFEEQRSELQVAANDKLSEAQVRAAKLVDHTLTILARVGEEGKLYGSVGTQDIASALVADGFEVQRSEVRMPEGAIRTAGDYLVGLQFHSDVVSEITVSVVAE